MLKKIEIGKKLNIKDGNWNSRIQKYFTGCAEEKVSKCFSFKVIIIIIIIIQCVRLKKVSL